MSSVVDKPKLAIDDDLLGLERYTTGLKKFIETSETPITVGIQGEWGSGKTSLMNTLREDLCLKENAEFFDVWINTWEYSLLSSVDETLVKIILGLIEDIGSISEKKSDKSFEKAISLGVGLLKLANSTGGLAGAAAGMTAEALKKKYLEESDATISQLRKSLQNVIDAATANGTKKKFIFFIDDLDRLDPTVAVNILELLKNIFDLEHCVFVIAVDYGVVIKGLKGKFGEMTESNEWEFRAFFDKIIQLPFTMPMTDYDISSYVSKLLLDIGYFNTKELKQEAKDKIKEIIDYTVGANPRSLKRMANSVSLIDIIRGKSSLSVDEKLMEFALICTQIAYPYIYNVILQDSNFVEWDLSFAKEQLRNKDIDTSTLESLKETEDFDEEWEQALWYMCQSSVFLRERVSSISKLLSFIVDNYTGNDFVSDLEMRLSASSVTNVSSDMGAKKPQEKVRYKDWDEYQKRLEETNVDSWLIETLKSTNDTVQELFQGDLDTQYTPGRISFKKAGSGRRKNFFVIDPKKRNATLSFVGSDLNKLLEEAEQILPGTCHIGRHNNVYMKIDKDFDFQKEKIAKLLKITYARAE